MTTLKIHLRIPSKYGTACRMYLPGRKTTLKRKKVTCCNCGRWMKRHKARKPMPFCY